MVLFRKDLKSWVHVLSGTFLLELNPGIYQANQRKKARQGFFSLIDSQAKSEHWPGLLPN